MNTTCNKLVVVSTRQDGSPVTRRCGEYYIGELMLCAEHFAEAQARYPQGWESYPGDRCKHGVYVGGVLEDNMCMRCEMGWD